MESSKPIPKGQIANFISDATTQELTKFLRLDGYVGTANDLKNLIIAASTGASGISIVPTSSAPSGTGIASFTATQAGTYTNYGGLVVSANSFAIISRSAAGVFSISQTALNLTTYAKTADISPDSEAIVLNSTLTDKYVNAGATSIVTQSGFITRLYNLSGVKSTRLVGEIRAGTGAQNYAFYNSTTLNGTTLISEVLGNGATQAINIDVPVPAGATILMLTKNPLVSEIIPLSVFTIKQKVSIVEILSKSNATSINTLTASVALNTNDLEGTIAKTTDLTFNSVLANQYVNAGATSIVTNAGFMTNLYTIGTVKKIKLVGELRNGTGAQTYAFYNSTTLNASTLISEVLGNGGTQTVNVDVIVPNGATIFIITKNPILSAVIPKYSLNIKGSINDLYSTIAAVVNPISTINYATTDFTGSVNKAFKDLQTKFPNGKFLICPSLKNGGYTNENNNEGVNMTYLTKNKINKFQQEYTDRILRCAELHSMATLDLYRVAGYDPLNPAQSAIFTANTTDKLHPNQAGHIRLADIMQNKIKDLFPQGTTGLKAIFIGDSITSNQAAHTPKVFYKYLAERLALRDDGMADSAYSTRNTIQYPKNAGVSGSGFSTFAPTNDPIVGRLAGYNSDYELIIVFAGVNDFYSSTLGVFGNLYL